MRPEQRLAVDVLLEDALAQHEPEAARRPPPRRVGRLVDDVPEIVEPAGVGRLAGGDPFLARLAALPRPRGEAENLDLDAGALECARQDVGAHRRDGDRPAAHRAGIVDQQADHGVAEIGLLLALVGEREGRVGDDARQPRGVEHALVEIELPGPRLLGYQAALQPVGEARDDALQMGELLVEEVAQPRQLVGVAQLLGLDGLIATRREGLVEFLIRSAGGVARQHAGPAGLARIIIAGARHHLAFGFLAAGILAVLAALRRAALERRLGAGRGALAALGLPLAVLRLVALALGFVAVLAILAVAEVEILDQPPRHPPVGFLVAGVASKIGDVLADAGLEIGPPRIADLARGGGRRLAGDLLARQQADRLRERHVAALRHPLVALPAIALVEHRREVVGDADHAAGAERLDARLLDGVVDGARGFAGRHAAVMDGLVVIAQAEGDGGRGPAILGPLGAPDLAAPRPQPYPPAPP